ncbi:MAG TPA: hypothetical protein VF062_28630 [Candidatus Limnocylindrales bacterium]
MTPTPNCPSTELRPEDPMEPLFDPPQPNYPGASTHQDHVVAVGGDIIAALGPGGGGFAGLVSEPGPALRLYWEESQPIPSSILAIIAFPRFPVSVIPTDAAFNRSYLESRADIIQYDTTISAAICGLMHTVVIPEEGFGLRVEAQPYEGVDPVSFPSLASSVLTARAGVPVQVDIGPVPTATGRQDDTSPWWGGARLRVGNKNCSSGFGVLRPAERDKQYLLTAAHCFNQGATVFNGVPVGMPGRLEVGTVRDRLIGLDSELVEVATGTFTASAVYTGEWDGPGHIAPVNTTGISLKGFLMFVCSSGASTGLNCGLNITSTNVRVLDILNSTLQRLQWVTDLVIVDSFFLRNIWKSVALGQGDSGGSVIQYSDNATKAKAMGTNVFGSRTTRCARAAPGVTCFSRAYYAEINNLLNTYGVNLVR